MQTFRNAETEAEMCPFNIKDKHAGPVIFDLLIFDENDMLLGCLLGSI